MTALINDRVSFWRKKKHVVYILCNKVFQNWVHRIKRFLQIAQNKRAYSFETKTSQFPLCLSPLKTMTNCLLEWQKIT